VAETQLPRPDQSGAVIVISGWRQVGKTTLLLSLRETALQAGLSVGGFLSLACFEAGTKTGIDLMDAATGTRLPLATFGGEGPVRTGHYGFDPQALEHGLRCAEAGQGADVFFVDELGPLELKRGEGWAAVIPMLRARTYGVALVVVRPELVDLARDQIDLPPDLIVLTVTEDNRDVLLASLTEWLAAFRPEK
jgi:nucleoside-triphosphatase THEP1